MNNDSDERLSYIADSVLAAIEKLPDPPRERIKKEFMKIKEMVLGNRPPRIVILGRRGAGKSSLINAMFSERVARVGSVLSETGKAEWHTLENPKGSIHLLDTRGIGDRTRPESANFEDAIDDIKSEINIKCPDAVLFLCKAKEVDAHISSDIANVIAINSYILEKHNYKAPVIAVLTQVDELDPKRVEPPYDDNNKKANILTAVNALKNAFDSSKIGLLKVIPVSAYAEYENNNIIYHNHWNIDLMLEFLIEVLPKSAQLQLARLASLKEVQRKCARVLVGSTATICAGIAATPIPLADAIPITMCQIGMITGIAYIAGRELSKKAAMEFLAALGLNLGIAVGLREGARALIKFVFPGGGNLISAGIAFAATWGIGEAAVAYFIDNATIEEAKQRFNKAKEENQNVVQPA